MTVQIEPKIIAPVNVDERGNLGIKTGDTVRVHQKIQEKGKTRIQVFEGLVIARKHGAEAGATFTVRATLSGVGVEKVFPLYSPLIDKIEIVRRSKVRRAKLYYIREKMAREIRRQLRNMKLVSIATESEREATERAEAIAKEVEEKAQAEAEATEKSEKEAVAQEKDDEAREEESASGIEASNEDEKKEEKE